VNPKYFQTMGIPLASGRVFDEAEGDHPVAVVSQLVADRLWPGQDAVGRRFRMGGDNESPLVLVTGVVGDVRGIDLGRPPTMTVYVPYWQQARGEASLVARTAAEPGDTAAAIRRVLRRLDSEMPLPALRTMDDIVAESVAPQRFQTTLVLLFGLSAVLLASLGIYGLVSYSVAQRAPELGIRMALGAMPGTLRQMVLRQALLPVAAGLAVGLAGSIAAGRLLQGLLFGVAPVDPVTAAAVVVVLGTVATVAGYVPARAATRVDPVTALRCD
jgi:putative ABC transport system permease protein